MDDRERKQMLFARWSRQERKNFDLFCKRNLWIRTKAGPIIRYRRNFIQRLCRGLKEEAVREGKPKRFIILKYRRGGISTDEQADSFHLTSNNQGQHAITLAHDSETTEEIFAISTLFYERMDPLRRPRRRALNKRELNFPDLRSRFYTGTAGTKGVGRGATIQKVHGSEVAKWPGGIRGVKDTMAGLTEAASEGEITLESTADGMGNWYQMTFFEAMKGGNDWTPIFLAWYMDPLNVLELDPGEKIKYTDEEVLLIRANKEWFKRPQEQIKWRRAKQKALKDLFPQEYPEDWVTAFLVTGSLFFSQQILRDLMARVRKPLSREQVKAMGCPKELLDGIQVWHPPSDVKKAYIGADSAEGIPGQDACHSGVVDLEGRQCAALHGYWKPEVYGRMLVQLARWYHNAILGVETENHGHSVMNTVQNECRYPHLYWHRDYDQYSGDAKIGWRTNKKTRPIMLDELREVTHEGFMEVNDEAYLAECFTFVNEGGKWQARAGTHDDSIFGWGIAWQVRGKGSQGPGYRELGDRPDMPPDEKESEKDVDDPGFVAVKVQE